MDVHIYSRADFYFFPFCIVNKPGICLDTTTYYYRHGILPKQLLKKAAQLHLDCFPEPEILFPTEVTSCLGDSQKVCQHPR